MDSPPAAPAADQAAATLAARAPRLLYVAGHFMAPPHTAGSQRPLALARRFAANGHDVTLLSTDAFLRAEGLTLADIPREDLGGVRVVLTRSRYDNAMGFTRRKVEFANQSLRQAALAIRDDHDLVYATSTPLTVLGPALGRNALRRTPFAFEVRDVWPQAPIEMGALAAPWQRRVAHRLADAGYRRAAHVVALSPDMRDMVRARGIAPDKVTVAPNAADPVDPGSVPAPEPGDEAAAWLRGAEVRGLYAGTVGLANDVDWIVDVAAALEPGIPVRIAIVGDGGQRAAVAARIRDAGDAAARRVRLFPARTRGDLQPLLAVADFALSTFADRPSLQSNSPNKVFEAFAHGLPVVTNNGGWLAEELRTHGSGLPLGRDPVEAAEHLGAWLADRDALAAAGEAARRRNLEAYNWDVVHATITTALAGALG